MSVIRAVEAATSDDRLGDGTVIGFLAVAAVVFIAAVWLAVVIGKKVKLDDPTKAALLRTGQKARKQLRGYGKNFMDGFNNRAIGTLALAVPAVSAGDVENTFVAGASQVLTGIWNMIYPFISVSIILFILFVVARKFASRGRS